ncbi:MAG: MFS transporter [Hymenobacteraceae bacterium]|nr:MFS transporter [Hymenobacteraceae bacterium]
MMIPELPGIITRLGGAEYKGLVIAFFTLTAGLSRPFSGKLADTIGRVPVMVVGSLVCVVCSLLYPLTTSVGAFLALRLLHGFSTGFKPTGTAAFLADIIPADRRGEAMGLLGIAGNLGMAAGPAIGATIAKHFTLNAMFVASSGAALLSVLAMIRMRETLPESQRERFRPGLLRLKLNEILEPAVLGPSLVMLLTVVPYGIVLTLIPDLSDRLGIANRGTFFTVFTLASLGIRFFAGRVSDRYGRVLVLKVSSGLLVVGLGMVAMAHTAAALLVAAVVFGVAVGMNSPTVYAWAIDWAHDERRGRALATAYLALEIGIGAGALLAGALAGTDARRVGLAFWVGAGAAVVAFGVLFLPWRQHPGAGTPTGTDMAAEIVAELPGPVALPGDGRAERAR